MLLDLRIRVFRHTQRLSLEFHEKYTSGRIIARQTSDLDALRELLDSGVSSLASGMLFMVFTATTVFALDWRSGLLVLAAGVPMYFLARWYQKHSQIAFRESRVVSARLIVHFVETMTGHPRGQGLPQGTRKRRAATPGSPRTTARPRSARSTSTASSSPAWC